MISEALQGEMNDFCEQSGEVVGIKGGTRENEYPLLT